MLIRVCFSPQCSFLPKFSIHIETKYEDNKGSNDSVSSPLIASRSAPHLSLGLQRSRVPALVCAWDLREAPALAHWDQAWNIV